MLTSVCQPYRSLSILKTSCEDQKCLDRISYDIRLSMLNVNENHPGDEVLLRVGAFSVFRPFTFGSKCVMDKTIKKIFMLHVKS